MTFASEVDPGRPTDIFVSYRRKDRDFVRALVPLLEARGTSVWWDADIEGGEDWRESIVESLSSCRLLLIVFSESCNSSSELKKELAVADHFQKEIVPVLIEDTEPRGFFLYELAPLNWIHAHPDAMAKLNLLAEELVTKIERARVTAGTTDAPSNVVLKEVPESVAALEPDAQLAPPPEPPAAAEIRTAGWDPPVVAVPKEFPGPISVPGPGTQLAPPLLADAPPPVSAAGLDLPPSSHDGAARRPRDFLPFRWFDFILPGLITLVTLLSPDEGVSGAAAIIGDALAFGLIVLALVGTIAFPIRFYRRKCNPYRVAKMLALSDLVLGLGAAAAVFFSAKAYRAEGQTTNEVRFYFLIFFVVLGLVLALTSFVIFVILSRRRARRSLWQGASRL
jgi:TIR domain